MKKLFALCVALVFTGLCSSSWAAPQFKVTLLSAASSSQTVPIAWPGGVGVFDAVGTFGGATVSLQFLAADGSTYLAVGGNTSLTAAGGGTFYLPACLIEVVITGGSPSGIYAEVGLVQN